MQKTIQTSGSGSFTEQRQQGNEYQVSDNQHQDQDDYGQTFGDIAQQDQAGYSMSGGYKGNFQSSAQGFSVGGGAVAMGGQSSQSYAGGSSSTAAASSSAQQSSQQTTSQTVTRTVVTTQRVSSSDGRLQMNGGYGDEELEMLAKGGYYQSSEGYMSASSAYRYGGYNLKADHAKLTGGLALGRYNFSDASLKNVQFKSQSGKVQMACDAAMSAAAMREAEYGGARMAGWELELQAMAEMRARYKLSANITIKQKAYLMYGEGFRRQKPDDEELEKQKCDDEDLSKKKPKPEDLNEEECNPDELFKKKPKKPEDLNEEECNPDDLFKKKPKKPEDLNEEECNPDDLFKKKPKKPEDLNEEECNPDELFKKKPKKPEDLNEEECNPDDLFKKKPKKPEDLNEEECNPDDLFKKKPKKPEDLNEEECNPDELFKKKPKKPEDLNEEECNPDELFKKKPKKPEDLNEEECNPDDLYKKKPKKPEDLNEEECNPDDLYKKKPRPLLRSLSPVIFRPMSERVLPVLQASLVYPVQSVRTIFVPTLVTCQPQPIAIEKPRHFSQSRIYSVRQPLIIQEEVAPTVLQGVQFGTPKAFRPSQSYIALSPGRQQQITYAQPQIMQNQLVPIQEVVQTIQVAAPSNVLQANATTLFQQRSQAVAVQSYGRGKQLSLSGIQYVSGQSQSQQYITVAQPSSQQFIQLVGQPQQVHFEAGSPVIMHGQHQLIGQGQQTLQCVQPALQQAQSYVLTQGQVQDYEMQRGIQGIQGIYQPSIQQAQSIITQTQPTNVVLQERMLSPIRQNQQLVQTQQYNVVPQAQTVTFQQQQIVHQPTIQAVVQPTVQNVIQQTTRQIQTQQIAQPLQQVQQFALAGSAMRHSAYVQMNPTQLVPVSIAQSIPIITTSPMYQSIVKIQPPPPPQIVRQRPIHVVDLEQYDDIWRKRVEELERILKELQNKKPEPVQQQPEQVIELRAGADTEDLEKQISQLQMDLYHSKEEYEELMQKYNESLKDAELLREQIKNHVCTDNSAELQKIIAERDDEIAKLKAKLANQPVANDDSEQLRLYQQRIAELEQELKNSILDLERFRQENAQFKSQIQFYKDQNDQKDEKIKELESKIKNLEDEIDQLNTELDEMQGEQEEIIEQKVQTIRNELKTWKDKFLALNVQYHDQQEKLMLTEAELEHIKKQGGASTKGSQVITTTTTKQAK